MMAFDGLSHGTKPLPAFRQAGRRSMADWGLYPHFNIHLWPSSRAPASTVTIPSAWLGTYLPINVGAWPLKRFSPCSHFCAIDSSCPSYLLQPLTSPWISKSPDWLRPSPATRLVKSGPGSLSLPLRREKATEKPRSKMGECQGSTYPRSRCQKSFASTSMHAFSGKNRPPCRRCLLSLLYDVASPHFEARPSPKRWHNGQMRRTRRCKAVTRSRHAVAGA